MKDLSGYYIREAVIKSIRTFFDQQNFHEVVVPVFNSALPVEPNIYPFQTEWYTVEGTHTLYLTTSPESGIKKMLAVGLGNAYSIGKCFRNLENSGRKHNPEFLMLEWYRENAEYQQIMRDVQALLLFTKEKVDLLLNRPASSILEYQGQQIELACEWPVLSLVDLFSEYVGLELSDIIDDDALVEAMQKKGYQTHGATWSQLFDQLFLNEIESHLPSSPYFLIDFPAKLSPLCKINKQKPYLAERFEFAIGGMELGNGNNENTDAELVAQKFAQEFELRKKNQLLNSPVDAEFIEALSQMNKKKYAGIGAGVDRIAMLFADTTDIKDVEFFHV
jgi:elongation factor P--(R)-beta-lysine ligase